jgi:hypothetical protein
MALYSLFIERDGTASAELAIKQYFDTQYQQSARSLFGEKAPMISAKGIVLFATMDPLVNM